MSNSDSSGQRSGKPVQPSNKAARIAAQQKAKQRKEMLRWLGAGLLVAFVAVAVLIWVSNRDDKETIVGGPENVATVVAGPVIPSSVQLNGTTMGDPAAPILVVEYGDYQCPFCAKFARQDMPTLIQEYVESGKIRFQFHELPIVGSGSDGSFDQDGESFRAAEAAMCANDQNLYWPYHDLLYANTLGEFKGSFTPVRLKAIALQVPGLDENVFNACIDNRSHTQTVLDLGAQAITVPIRSTPTFVVNGKPVVGADYEDLKAVIEEQLAGP